MKRLPGMALLAGATASFSPWSKRALSRISNSRLRRYAGLIVPGILLAVGCLEIAASLELLSGKRIAPAVIFFAGLLSLLLVLGFYYLLPRQNHIPAEREIDVASLLGRAIIPLQSAETSVELKGSVILVTGAAGSIGSELCRQLLDYDPELLIALDSNETGLFDLGESLRAHPNRTRLCLYISDITHTQGLDRVFRLKRPRIVFHAAAYKHVPLLEYFPDQAVRTNVLATYTLCCLAQHYQVAHFVFVSSDKAAMPTGVLGASKRLGELIVQSLANANLSDTRFCAVRFGNVIGSRGSVVPIFHAQIARGGPVTVTDPQATRYFMTIAEACGLVILTSSIADRGGLYQLDMGEPVRIIELARKMIASCSRRSNKPVLIAYTGLRPGEHLHETLIGINEKLIPLAHNKIFAVACTEPVPTLATVMQWMHTLEILLQQEDYEELRRYLFEVVRSQGVLASLNGGGSDFGLQTTEALHPQLLQTQEG